MKARYNVGWVNYTGLFNATTHELDNPEIVYEMKPHYKLFPFVWFDLWRKDYVLGSNHLGSNYYDTTINLTLLASRQKKSVVLGMMKLVKDE
jgi:hypothetical protein